MTDKEFETVTENDGTVSDRNRKGKTVEIKKKTDEKHRKQDNKRRNGNNKNRKK